MSQLTQEAFEAEYNSSGSGSFATNVLKAIGSTQFRKFAKDISDTFYAIIGDNPDVSYREGGDFVTYENQFSTSSSGAGTGINQASTFGVDNTEHAFGVESLTTGTTNAGYTYIVSPGTAPLKFGLGHKVVLKFRVAAELLSTGGETFTMYLGFGDGVVGAEHSNGCYFKYTHGTNSGKYQCVTAAATVRTATDSGVAQTILYKTFEIRVAADASSVTFLIDGTVVATNTSNIPSAGSQLVFGIVKSAGTTARLMDIDWYSLAVMRSAAR